MAGVIALDASVLIAILDEDDAHHATTTTTLARYSTEDWAVSALTLAEVLVRPAGDADSAAEAGEHLTELDLTVVDLRDVDAEELATLRSRTGLRMPDCCVLLVSATHGAAIATIDEALRRAALALGLEVVELLPWLTPE
ncbi:type II toxin-antitoxin system VapC family toxin [Ornithinimicrobium sp. Y1847]|uniref:type II toxin-antitoxin system VapC family toxin n=1 Tax=Ornithinimicrobium sp. Y1847 TaxID=3405419 RepID=UPI003B6830FF